MFRTAGAVDYTDLETTREHVQEVLRLHAEYGFMSVVFAHIAFVDLLNLDVGEGRVVEQSVAKGRSAFGRNVMRLVLTWPLAALCDRS